MTNNQAPKKEITLDMLPISPEVLRALKEMGYETPTPIQQQAIPPLIGGQDVVGRSQTGTGKTAAFGVPAIELVDPALRAVQVLILCPTRELAMQATGEIEKFSRYKQGIKAVSIYGGSSMERQINQLRGGANIVIGTPGRVMDHMRRRTLRLDNLRLIVLDEADEMLNMGFREDIETILADVPDERQTALFSATMPPAIMAITEQYQTEPVLISIGADNAPISAIEQYYYEAPSGRKMDVLALLLHRHRPRLSIVFCNTKNMVDELCEYLSAQGFAAAGLHGDMKQSARTQTMQGFKNHRTPILIATDVAARGIDVQNVDAVFNYDVPQDTEYYIHRIGRTARAGKKGCAYTIVSGRRQVFTLRDIMRATGSKIVQRAVPTRDEVQAARRELFAQELVGGIDLLREEAVDEARNLIATLPEEVLESGELMAQLMALYMHTQLPELPALPDVSLTPARRDYGAPRGSTTGITLEIGRRQSMAPNYILGAIVQATGLPGKAVGKIDIQDEHTTVTMADEDIAVALGAMQNLRINGHRVAVRAAQPRDFAPAFAGHKPRPRPGQGRGRNDRTDRGRGKQWK